MEEIKDLEEGKFVLQWCMKRREKMRGEGGRDEGGWQRNEKIGRAHV